MPYIQSKLSIVLSEEQKSTLQKKLLDIVVSSTSKPKNFVMTNIEDNQDIWMSDTKIDKSAYIEISLLGSVSKQTCGIITKEICDFLQEEYLIDGKYVYVSFHPLDLWGWNGQMF